MNNLGNLSMVASADSFSEFLFRKKALERIFTHDQEILITLIQDQTQLNEVLGEIKIRKERKLELEKELKHQIANMVWKEKSVVMILSEIRRKKSLEQDLIEAYRQAAVILDNTIASLKTENDDSGVTKFTSG
jgi:peptidoglycan hydrolase CwlO-like protein